MADDPYHPRIEDSSVESHPFKAAFHGNEDGSPGYLSVESGYIIPSGFIGGLDAILPKFAGADLQDQHHTSELTHIVDPRPGDYYVEATGEWRMTGHDGTNKIEIFEPHTAEIKHHSDLDLTHEKKRALKIFRLESDGRINQMIKSDIPLSVGRTQVEPPPWEPPPDGSDSGSSRSSSSSSGLSGSSGSWTPVGSDSSSGSIPYKWATFDDHVYPPLIYPGISSNVQVSLRNEGTLPWDISDQLIPMGYDWGLFSVPVPVTYPGVLRDFNFSITAPMTPGTYTFSWRLYGDGNYYGEQTPVVDIVVPGPTSSDSGGSSSSSSSAPHPSSSSSHSSMASGSGSGPVTSNNAIFITQVDVPESMEAGTETEVNLSFRNTGSTIWVPDPYFLRSQLPPGNTTWGSDTITLPGIIPPGGEHLFPFTITAPMTLGVQQFQWQMWNAFDGYFGGASTVKEIEIVPAPVSGSSSSS